MRLFSRLLISLAMLPTLAIAQSGKTTQFGKIRIAADAALNLYSGNLDNYYQKPKFYGVSAGASYLGGFAEASFEYAGFTSRTGIPSFQLYTLSAGYTHRLSLPVHLYWLNGAAVGNAYMNFNDAAIAANLRQESELLLRLHSTLQYQIGAHFGIGIGAEWMRIFTYHRIDFVNARIQLSYLFNNSAPLQKCLN